MYKLYGNLCSNLFYTEMNTHTDIYIHRIADTALARHLAAWPAEFITGPRAVGKTTTALRYAGSVLRLDRPAERGLALDDPDAAIAEGPFPLLIDEWQHVPDVLLAVKRAVDDNLTPILHAPVTPTSKSPRQAHFHGASGDHPIGEGRAPARRGRQAAVFPGQRVHCVSPGYPFKPLHEKSGLKPSGRYIITGSARNDLHTGQWPLTGRVLDTRLWPLTGRERFGDASAPSLFDRWDTEKRFTVPSDPPDILGYLDLALEGGFPGAITASAADALEDWMRAYVDVTITRDLGEFYSGNGRKQSPEALRRYLVTCSLHTGGVAPDIGMARSANLNGRTASRYHEILTVLRLIADIPAWHTNRLKRLTSMPKRCMIDSGLAAWLMGVDREALKHDTDARGRIIETFVAAQLRTEVEASRGRANMYHLRTQGGDHEVDLIVEFGRRVVAFEVKTTSAPRTRHARHIAWLRRQLSARRFAGGVVFHTGPHRYRLAEGIEAVPIAGLWG